MDEHTKLPWKVFTTTDGRKLVGIGSEEGEGILDCGFGVWAWNDPAGIANANLIVNAVNSHDHLVKALDECRNVLAMMIEPETIKETSTLHAWSHAVAVERKARATLAAVGSPGKS